MPSAICTSLNTTFTPQVGAFNIQVTRDVAVLERKQIGATDWAKVGTIDPREQTAFIVDNPISGAQYRFTSTGNPTVQADQ
jgi:hypothetical protein